MFYLGRETQSTCIAISLTGDTLAEIFTVTHMNKKQKQIVSSLVEEGKKYSFENNRKISRYDGNYYSEATDDLMS